MFFSLQIVFKEDKTNYNGLVFVGKAAAEMGQLEQGVAAYRKAIDTEPNQELAWQVRSENVFKTYPVGGVTLQTVDFRFNYSSYNASR